MTPVRRRSDYARVALLTVATAVAGAWPARTLFAQGFSVSQDYINGTVAQTLATLTSRLDRIDNMVNAVLVALVINFIVQLVQIKRGTERRG